MMVPRLCLLLVVPRRAMHAFALHADLQVARCGHLFVVSVLASSLVRGGTML